MIYNVNSVIQLICTKHVVGDTTDNLLTWAYVIWSDSYTNFEPHEWPRHLHHHRRLLHRRHEETIWYI